MFLLTSYAPGAERQSKTPFVRDKVAELEWQLGVDYVGDVCSNKSMDGHCNMPMLRNGPLIAKVIGTNRPDVIFCRNGEFEVCFKRSLAEKTVEAFPGVRFNDVTLTHRNLPVDDYVELDRPIRFALDLRASGYQLGETCPVCGQTGSVKASEVPLVLEHGAPGAHVGTALQGLFSTFVSDEFADFLIENAEGCFALVGVEVKP